MSLSISLTSLKSLSLAREQHSPASRDPLGGSTSISPVDSNLQKAFSRAVAQITLIFLRTKELALNTEVCRDWNGIIDSESTWKQQCKIQLDVSTDDDLEKYRPPGRFYKESLKLLISSIIDGNTYETYIGKVGPVPRIPKEISLTRWNEADPCDPNKKIGTEYVWMYRPSHVEISVPGDFPLKMPVTINNIGMLFCLPKIGNPSKYAYIWHTILKQEGDKRITAGWTCIKKKATGRNLSYPNQLALAKKNGVVPSDLATRILYNYWGHVRSGEANVYPDGQDPWTFVRTPTLIHTQHGGLISGCGTGGPSGLLVDVCCDRFVHATNSIGMGVELPTEVQAIRP